MSKPVTPTPVAVARGFRSLVESQIQKTWDEYFARPALFSAWELCKIIQEGSGCTFQEANAACIEVFPEMYAEYWEKLPST